MRRTHVRKTEYVGLFVEPDLRATIDAEAARRDASVSHTIRSLIRIALSTSSHSSAIAEMR